MTVATDYQPHRYLPGSAQAPEGIPFQYLDPSDLLVERVTTAGVRFVLSRDVHYTLAGDGMARTGRITAIGAYASDRIEVSRRTNRLQKLSIPPHQPLPAAGAEAQFDRQALIAQEQAEFQADLASRSLVLPKGEAAPMLPSLRNQLSKLLGTTADGALAWLDRAQFRGEQGIPGANVMATGAFSSLFDQDVREGTDLLQTSGGTRGQLVADATFSDADVAAFPRMVVKTRNGRVFRRDEAFIDLREVGLNNDPANNTGAWNEALAYLKRFGNNNSAIYRGTPRLRLPPGVVPIGRVNIKQTVIVEGDGMGHEGANVTILKCGPTGGITVERADTLNGTVVPGETGGGDGTILRGFALDGGVSFPTGRDSNPGISLKARATLRDMYISRFAGAGVRIVASAGGAGVGELKGNANLWRMQDVTSNLNYDGVYISGDDTNSGYGIGVNVNSNVSCGVLDASTLGNTHIGYHSAGNGNSLDGKFVMVSSGGKRYVPAWGADGLWSTTQPGTNTNVWKFFENGGPIGQGLPEWYSGIPVKFGAAYATTNRNARALWLGCYTEGTQAPAQIAWPSMAIGGLLSQVGDGMFLNGEQRALQALFFKAAGAFLDGENSALAVEGFNVPTMRLKPDPQGYVAVDFGNNTGFRPVHIHGPGTSDARGANTFEIRNRLGLPGGGAHIGFAATAPTSSLAYRAVVYNSARSAATQPMGWSNVPNSTTWVPFGAQPA